MLTHTIYIDDHIKYKSSPIQRSYKALFTGLVIGIGLTIAIMLLLGTWAKPLPSSITPSPIHIQLQRPLLPQAMPKPPETLTLIAIPAETAKPKEIIKNIPKTSHSAPQEKQKTPLPKPVLLAPSHSQQQQEPITNNNLRVFNPRLRQQLKTYSTPIPALNNPSNRLLNTSTQLNYTTGTHQVQHKGKCFTVRKSPANTTSTYWSLPHDCAGALSESDKMAQGLRKAMRLRFGKQPVNN